MDLEVLKKKISTYRGDGGRVGNVNDELLGEILFAWESWSGPLSGFYSAIGVSQKKMARMLGRAKKLKREGAFEGVEFKEVRVEGLPVCEGAGIEVVWEAGKVIRFSEVEQLVDFLKKVA